MLVDDDATRVAAVEAKLRDSGYDVVSIISETSALLFQIERHRPDIVLIDLRFPAATSSKVSPSSINTTRLR